MRGASAASPSGPAALALLAAANVTLPRLSRGAFLPASLATGAGLVWLARRDGATWSDLRMEPAAAPRGLAWGAAIGIPAATSVALLAATPVGRTIAVDEQAATARRRDLAYHLLLRIPFGTALPEEVAFRAALPAILARRTTRRAADTASAVLFGLWHVVDAVRQLRTHPRRELVTSTVPRRAASVAATVLVTGAAGRVFAAVRDRAGSVAAPAVVHAAVNAAGLVAGVVLARRAAG